MKTPFVLLVIGFLLLYSISLTVLYVSAGRQKQVWSQRLKEWQQAVTERDTQLASLQQKLQECQESPSGETLQGLLEVTTKTATSPQTASTSPPSKSSPPPIRPTPISKPQTYTAHQFDFQQTRWGMSKADVIKSEKGQPPLADKVNIEGVPYVVYSTNFVIADVTHDVLIIYYFVQDQLFYGRYNIITQHSNKNDYLADFDAFKATISKKYGTPEEETIWKDDLYKDKPQDWGIAVITGDLQKFATWETDTTIITLQLKGENYEINFAVKYEAKDQNLQQLIKKQQEKRQQESF